MLRDVIATNLLGVVKFTEVVRFCELNTHLCSTRSNCLSLFQSSQNSVFGSLLLGRSLLRRDRRDTFAKISDLSW
jgi:hypothetical protein